MMNWILHCRSGASTSHCGCWHNPSNGLCCFCEGSRPSRIDTTALVELLKIGGPEITITRESAASIQRPVSEYVDDQISQDDPDWLELTDFERNWIIKTGEWATVQLYDRNMVGSFSGVGMTIEHASRKVLISHMTYYRGRGGA